MQTMERVIVDTPLISPPQLYHSVTLSPHSMTSSDSSMELTTGTSLLLPQPHYQPLTPPPHSSAQSYYGHFTTDRISELQHL